MEKLRTKTFFTLYLIFTIFLITILFIFNFQNYTRERNSIKQNLYSFNSFVDNGRKKDRMNPAPQDDTEKKENNENDFPKELDRRIVMDYEMYTILLDSDNNVVNKISHSENEKELDIDTIINDVISTNKEGMVINSLYFSDYAYNYKNGNYLIVINTSNIKARLYNNLFVSLIVFVIFEIIIFIIAKLISNWITKPALDSYQKQKNFIADASHELKTPVAVIMASADALEGDMSEKKWLNNIKQETEKMNNLITNLLNLSKMENENDKSMYTNNDLSKIVNKCVLTFESLAFEKSLKIKSDVIDSIIFKSNSLEMNELISILIDNAIKHADAKSTINVNLSKKSDDIILEVSNKGDEIAPSDYEKIFERFYRADESHNRNSNRYGLGLAIAKSIVNNHNGKISVISKNHITTFKVILKK